MSYFGFFIFFATHLFSLKRSWREQVVAKIGFNTYRLLYSLLAFVGLYLVVKGWSSLPYIVFYEPPKGFKHLNLILMFFAFLFLLAAYIPNNLRLKIKNPMLTGVKLWAVGHLLANGDSRSLLLFGSFLAYSVIDVIVVKKQNRHIKKQPVAFVWNIVLVFVTAIVYTGVLHLHARLFGVTPF